MATAESLSSTREAILSAATELFADRGYEGTSLNDIADAVGIRRPSLLHHFASKTVLYQEVFARAVADFAVRVDEAVVGPLEGWQMVDHVLDASFAFFVANPDFVRLIAWGTIEVDTGHGVDLGLGMRPIFERACAFMQAEMDAGRFRRQDPAQLLLTGFEAIFGYFRDASFLEALVGEDPVGEPALSRRLDHVRDVFRAALSPPA